jgi:hypothetical protein
VQSTSSQIADPAEQLRRLLRVADVALAHLSPEDPLDELLVRVRELPADSQPRRAFAIVGVEERIPIFETAADAEAWAG